jgi:hypothetical protein
MLSIPVAIAFGFCFGLLLVAQEVPEHARDGGTREMLQSIDIPTVANAAFSATVATEWSRILPDGSTQTTKNHRTVARDSSGRVFEERRFFSPKGDVQDTPLSALEYRDPNRHEQYLCSPQSRVCFVSQYNMPTSTSLPRPGSLPGGIGSVTVEDLGRKTIESIDVVGSREVTTINAGVVGNQKAEPTIKEFWYSQRLGINLITKRFDPHVSGVQNFEVKNINLDEPDPKLFEPPSDYRVVKMDAQ